MNIQQENVISISGAGPAGLAAAMAIADAGKQAVIYEKRDEVGHRFHGDFQGLENWTMEKDVLDEFSSMGITPDFDHQPIHELNVYGPEGICETVRSKTPLLYLVRRGPEPGTLEDSLKRQAFDKNVQIQFSDTIDALPNGGIVTQGPHRADIIAVGYLFETDMADGLHMVVMDELAPMGYAYLVIWNGRGTLATCMFDDFHHERLYLQRTLDFFTEKLELRMENPRHFGGSGNYQVSPAVKKGYILYAGESAGFQDPLFGFGIRWAVLSGAAAGHALARNHPDLYEQYWKTHILGYQKTGITNRWFYNRLGNNGYLRLMKSFPADGDIRQRMHHEYKPRLWKHLWYHVTRHNHARLFCITPGCECTWCRCERSLRLSQATA